MSAEAAQDRSDALRQEIERSGYYPDLVREVLATSLADESVNGYLVHHETTFDHNEVRRHVTVLVLTPTRLIVSHTDEFPADSTCPTPYASASTEAVRIDEVSSVVITRIVGQPAKHSPGASPREVLLTIGWGAISRIELEPASCGDPDCTADHGYSGSSTNDDLALRVSEAADGADSVSKALDFAAVLSAATARPRSGS